MKQGRQHKLISTIFLATSVTKKLDHNIGYLVILPQVIRHIKPIRFGWNDVRHHIKPLCVLFVAVIATTIYQMIDKALLGYLSTEENVAYYEYANKIVNVPVNLVYVMGTVLMPRACAYAAKGDKANQIKYLNYSLHFVGFLGIGAAFGLLSVANLFSIVYYGNEFSYCGGVIIALSPIIFILGIENIIRTQYMIPNHMDKCIFRKNCASVPEERSAIPLQTEQNSAG